MRRLTTLALALPLSLTPWLLAQDPADDLRLLREAGAPSDPAGLTAWLNGLRPSAEVRDQAEALVRQLGADDFDAREKASADLRRLGPSVLPVLRKAQDSADPEVGRRAAECLNDLRARAPKQAVVAAAARRLEAADSAEAALALLDLFASVSEDVTPGADPLVMDSDPQSLADQAGASLQRLLRRSQKAACAARAALADKLPSRRCAAAVALALAGDADALPDARRLLEDGDRGVRLGVARVLALQKDKAAVAALIALLDRDDGCAALAEETLEGLAGDDPPALAEGDSAEAVHRRRESWQAWWEKNESRAGVFDPLTAGVSERFAAPAKDVTSGYHSFQYEATAPGCKAEVAGGRLLLRGDHDEGDQRLFVTARKATGRARWPKSLEVAVRLGGTAGDNIGWHVGVSVGRVKVLFHPTLQGGEFRTEEADTHQHLHGNEDMSFTPAADAAHTMTIRVRRIGPDYRFDVTVADALGGGKFRKAFDVTAEQMGSYDRVGLERSGRRGGDALFESLSIKPGK